MKASEALILQEIEKMEKGIEYLEDQIPILFRFAPAELAALRLNLKLHRNTLDILKLMARE